MLWRVIVELTVNLHYQHAGGRENVREASAPVLGRQRGPPVPEDGVALETAPMPGPIWGRAPSTDGHTTDVLSKILPCSETDIAKSYWHVSSIGTSPSQESRSQLATRSCCCGEPGIDWRLSKQRTRATRRRHVASKETQSLSVWNDSGLHGGLPPNVRRLVASTRRVVAERVWPALSMAWAASSRHRFSRNSPSEGGGEDRRRGALIENGTFRRFDEGARRHVPTDIGQL
jgi:hypothetical protein